MPRWFTRNDNWDFGGRPDPAEDQPGEPKSRKRRLALTFVFTVVFFAGASLAAVAGNKFSAHIADDESIAIESTTTTDDSSSSEATPAEVESAAPASDPADAPPATDEAGSTPR